jgi:transcriptional regulator with GAF, ATPase, and Fis domain
VQRLGSAEVVRVDARIVSATNAHLLSLVREGKFREDLYYRLCGFPIEIPGLRDRWKILRPWLRFFWKNILMVTALALPCRNSPARLYRY